MEEKLKIDMLENKIKRLEFNQNILMKLLLSNEPEWSLESLKAAEKKGLNPIPYVGVNSTGSYDFYRLIDLLYKLGLFD
ncbi:hypothetical protein [Enterococcus sp. DIV0840c]|uniref:hypothetical protein n=1 Tax=Enterococcus sp. DIV0840c TaxID=2774772 RepID=UPI003D29E6C0